MEFDKIGSNGAASLEGKSKKKKRDANDSKLLRNSESQDVDSSIDEKASL